MIFFCLSSLTHSHSICISVSVCFSLFLLSRLSIVPVLSFDCNLTFVIWNNYFMHSIKTTTYMEKMELLLSIFCCCSFTHQSNDYLIHITVKIANSTDRLKKRGKKLQPIPIPMKIIVNIAIPFIFSHVDIIIFTKPLK